MRNIFKSRLGRASIALAIAGSALLAVGASAEARPYEHWNHWNNGRVVANHWNHPYWHNGYQSWSNRGWYGPRYYAPPVVAYPPPAYYPPQGLTFNIPLG